MVMTKTEIGYFLTLFNRGGNIPGFNVLEFNAFTMSSIGIPLCEHYGLSKGKSLTRFVYEADEKDSTKLLLELLKHYEENYQYFHSETGYGDENSKEPIWAILKEGETPEYKKQYEKCKAVADRLSSGNIFTDEATKTIKEAFSSEYIDNQLQLMLSMQKENPTEAIGKAKELIESCCKGILDEYNIAYDAEWKIQRYVKETMDCLRIMPKYIPENVPGAESIKAILNHLKTIAQNVAELRNPYGSGHGKAPGYKGLEERHAKLAVGSALTLVNFLWDSHLRMKSKETVSASE